MICHRKLYDRPATKVAHGSFESNRRRRLHTEPGGSSHGRVRSAFVVQFMALTSSTTRYLHYAVHVVWIAALNLNLDRAVSNFELTLQLFSDSAQHILAASDTLFLNTNVADTTNHARTDGPHVQIVDGQDTSDSINGSFDRLHFHTLRNAFQQHVDRLFHAFGVIRQIPPPGIVWGGSSMNLQIRR